MVALTMTLPLAFAGLDPLTSVGIVLLALFVALSWLSRRGPSGLPVGTRRERSFTLTGQHAVHVIEVAGSRLLVGTGPSGAPRLLAELGPVEAVAESTAGVEAGTGGESWAWLRSLGDRLGLEPHSLSNLVTSGRGPRGH